MSKKKNSDLIEIRDLLEEEMNKFNAINDELIDNQNDFEKISENYNRYNNLIDKGHTHISDLKRQEFYENLFVYFGFYFFFGCVIYVLSKRFPIHRIIFFGLKQIYKIIMLFIPGKKSGDSAFDSSLVNKTNTSFDTIMNETNITFIENINRTSESFDYDITPNNFFYFININITYLCFDDDMSIDDSSFNNETNNTNSSNNDTTSENQNFEYNVDKDNSTLESNANKTNSNYKNENLNNSNFENNMKMTNNSFNKNAD